MSASLPSSAKVKQYWDFFFQAETGTYEKSTWLDLLLAEILLQLKDGIAPENIITFCPLSGVRTLVGCELLCGVHRITSTLDLRYTPPIDTPENLVNIENVCDSILNVNSQYKFNTGNIQTTAKFGDNKNVLNASVALQKYLLKGSAWRCLALLQSLGVGELSCSQQLCGVLIWLYGEVSTIGVTAHGKNPFILSGPDKKPVYELFSNRLLTKSRKYPINYPKKNNNSVPEPSKPTRSRKRSAIAKPNPNAAATTSKDVHTSESENQNEELELLNRSLTLKMTTKKSDVESFYLRNETGDSSFASSRSSHKKPKPSVQDFITDRHREVLDSEICPFEFVVMVVNLLKELCQIETENSDQDRMQVRMQCIHFSLRNLWALQFQSSPAPSLQYGSCEIAHLKSAFTELLIVSLDKTLVQPDLCCKNINSGIMPMLLRLLEDVTYKIGAFAQRDDCRTSELQCKMQHDVNEAQDTANFVFGVSYSVIAFLYCLLLQSHTINKIREFTEQFKLFADCQKGLLLRKSIAMIMRIPNLNDDIAVTLCKKLVDMMGRLVGSMKRIRSEVVHTAACPKKKHKSCRDRVTAGMHHHHNILGESSPGMGISPACCVSLLYGSMVSLLSDDLILSQSTLRIKILKAILISGSCCCFPPGYLLEKLVRVMMKHHTSSNLCFSLLENTLYGELGAACVQNTGFQNLPCAVCERYVSADEFGHAIESYFKISDGALMVNDSLQKYWLQGFQSATNQRKSDDKTLWSFLVHYCSLLQLDNNNVVLQATMSHLMRIAPKCKTIIRHELLFNVLYPTFVVGKSRYLITHEDASYFITLSCLSIFAMLLNNVSFAEEFIQNGGLGNVLELIAYPEFSKQCCSVLEIAVIVEIWKLTKDGTANFVDAQTMASLTSLSMLISSLQSATRKFFKIYKLRLDLQVYERLVNINHEMDILDGFIVKDEINLTVEKFSRQQSTPISRSKPIDINYRRAMTMEEMGMMNKVNIVENFIESLKNVWTFWKTCAGLCLYSPLYRKYFIKQSIFVDSLKMAKVVAFSICDNPASQAEVKLLVRILESMLTINLAVSDCSMDKSKLAVVGILKDILLQDNINRVDSANIKLLCEMIIRASTTSASDEQVMPPINKAKLPPLLCSSVDSDEKGSSTDDDDLAKIYDDLHMEPYICEDSDPSYQTADEGYDADVEIGAVYTITSTGKIQKVYKTKDAEVDCIPVPEALNSSVVETSILECNEYEKSSLVTHPELCIMVVDILLQLIDRLLESFADAGVNVMGPDYTQNIYLAKTCCTRLSTALSRPPSTFSRPHPVDAYLSESGQHSQSLMLRLLGGSGRKLLTTNSEALEDLQKSVLGLMHILASHSITPSELEGYLKLFAAPNPPFKILLNFLGKLVDNIEPNMPDFILCFPIEPGVYSHENHGEFPSYVTQSGFNVASHSMQADHFSKVTQEKHRAAGLTSPWSFAAVRGGVDGVGWGLWMLGFAAGLWLRLDDGRPPAGPPPHPSPSASPHRPRDESDDSSDSMSEWGIISDNWQEVVFESEKQNSPTQEKKAPTVSDTISEKDVIHLISIGHESLVLEVWVDTATGNLIFKLSRPDSPMNSMCEAVVESEIPLHKWSHLAFNVKDTVYKKKINIVVSVFVNGCQCVEAELPLQGILFRKPRPTSLLVGHVQDRQTSSTSGACFISGLSLFRSPILNQFNALYMMAHGPNASPFSNCQVGYCSPNYAGLFSQNILTSNIDWDRVFETSFSMLKDLQDNILLTYSAQTPSIMNLYHQTVTHPAVVGRVSSTGIGGGGRRGIPEAVGLHWEGPPQAGRTRGLAPAAHLLGGPHAFLYLYARTVELDGTSEEQACALSLLIKLSYSDNRLFSTFYDEDCLSMLQTVLSSPKCLITHHLLKAFLDAACSAPILGVIGDRFHVLTRSDAVILEPILIITIMRAWREFERQNASNEDTTEKKPHNTGVQYPPSVWMYERIDNEDSGGLMETLFLAMHVLLRDDHPHHAFNAYQLNRVNMMENLLLLCKERFLNSDFGILSDNVSCSLVELVRALIGAPPSLHHLALIMDFLVLMHQASDTFVTHARSNFYFLLTPLTQQSFNATVNLIRPSVKKRATKSKKRYSLSLNSIDSDNSSSNILSWTSSKSDLDTNSIYTDSEDVINDNSLNVTKEMSLNVSTCSNALESSHLVRELMPLEEIAINPTITENISGPCTSKDVKALINLKIKQSLSKKGRRRRKSRRSPGNNSPAMSEVGDPNIPEIHVADDATFSTHQQGLTTDYVVIDSDEVDRNTVQMFSSGIYHQTKVKSGAAPGWVACEGFLLLLRDNIYMLPDTSLNQALGVVVQSASLLVLGKHAMVSVRTGIVRVIAALAERIAPCPPHHYLLLANQLAMYRASADLISAAAALVTGCQASLDKQLQEAVWMDVHESAILKAPPVLALLPRTLHDLSLTHKTILFIKKIIDKGSIKALSDIGVCEVVVQCLKAVGSISNTMFDGRELILSDLYSVLCQIAIKSLLQQHNHQIISDIHNLLTFVELSEAEQRHSSECHVIKVARSAQCCLFEHILDHLEERLSAAYCAQAKASGYLAAVLGAASEGSLTGAIIGNLTRSELLARHKNTLLRAITFILSRDCKQQMITSEITLLERIFVTLLNAFTGISPGLKPKWWAAISGGDYHTQLYDLFSWILSPLTTNMELKKFALSIIYNSPSNVQTMLTPSDPSNQRKISVYIMFTLLALDVATTNPLEMSPLVDDWARNWVFQMQAVPLTVVDQNCWNEEAAHYSLEDYERGRKILQQGHQALVKTIFNKEWLTVKLTESAMSITRQVVDVQNSERKAFMDHLRRCQSDAINNTQRWQKVIDNYTHELAIWYDQNSYPKSWELDPTEGPARVRVRLKRCHLNINKKFLKDGYKHKADDMNKPTPLSFLLTWTSSSYTGGLVERLHANESVCYMSRATHVTVADENRGDLLLSDRCIHFLPEPVVTYGAPMRLQPTLSCSLDTLVQVVQRRWRLRERAVELFLTSGHAHLIAFDTTEDMDSFLKALNNSHLPNRSETESLSETMNLWRNGLISNWEYLMRLNGWAGRTYNDLMQYPVFPFILADYTSPKLDLSQPNAFRDLHKPMAVQDRRNESHYINNYNYLKQARREGSTLITGVNKEPYHYGSHYSNSGTVLHFLVRLPPFTKMFLNYQDNNFDIPDRTFHSVQTTWRLTSCDSTTDVKELIPEFFYLTDFLVNSEGLALGVRQCGEPVESVKLPKWAPNVRLFMLVHRQALESPLATEGLPHWIDLVFGYKQTGQAAVDAVNVFHPATYYGFDPSSISDEVERAAWETMVRTYGQTPRQLLRQPHPHTAINLYQYNENAIPIHQCVFGGRWGRYCGSPGVARGATRLMSVRPPPPGAVPARLAPLPAACRPAALPPAAAAAPPPQAVAALPSDAALLPPMHSHHRIKHIAAGHAASSVSLLTWGHSDTMVRLKQRRDSPPEPIMQIPGIDLVMSVDTCGTGAWFGMQSGRILVIRCRAPPPTIDGGLSAESAEPPLLLTPSPPPRCFRRRPAVLRAHCAAVLCVRICAPFHVAVSAGADGRIVVWDLNRLTYLRLLPGAGGSPVAAIAVSETLCDVASVHRASEPPPRADGSPRPSAADGSLLRVRTVNGSFVGEVKVAEEIASVCYSNAPEGASVNCIAVGLATGAIRLYSSWDLKAVSYISAPNYTLPVVSIVYSNDSQYLFGLQSDGTVLTWESDDNVSKSSHYRILTSQTIF